MSVSDKQAAALPKEGLNSSMFNTDSERGRVDFPADGTALAWEALSISPAKRECLFERAANPTPLWTGRRSHACLNGLQLLHLLRWAAAPVPVQTDCRSYSLQVHWSYSSLTGATDKETIQYSTVQKAVHLRTILQPC